ncbi:MAG: acylneuraminate cytidylyltransferase [Planctomycetes bacterium]|nr:acylneuraminate cytidylyltransferase [Planctomycetota bacterium]
MRLIAIIPARGGSKGIPDKNLQEIGGIPLVARCVEAALGCGRCERVVVTTDSERIADVARAAGAEVVTRPAALAGDSATSESALLHALDELNERGVRDPDGVLFLQCTSPLTTASDLAGLVESWEEANADVALAVVPSHRFLWRPGPDGSLRGVNHDMSVRLRRQDLPLEYRETGAAYLFKTAGFRAAGHRFFGKVVPHVLPSERSVDVDDLLDLELARAQHTQASRGESPTALPKSVSLVVFDFDGTLTDNRVLVDQEGREAVSCSRSDGMGISLLRASGVEVFVISKERNPVVRARCEKLGIEFLQAIDDKLPVLQALVSERGYERAQTVFVGNDVNDVECLEWVGCGVAVADAHPRALAAADLVLERSGGQGAARELADRILGCPEA